MSKWTKLLFPFFVWLWLCRDFLTGRIPFSTDTMLYYAWVKYFINNIQAGVFPLWEPFVGLGRAFVYINTTGVFNPLQTLSLLGLTALGVSDYAAYMTYLVFSFFLSAIGFYALARLLFKDKLTAWLAYLLFLLSGIGLTMFNQYTFVLLFLPTVWFLFFLVRFIRCPAKADFLGMTFCVMLALNAYVPFYLMTLVLILTVCGAVIYQKDFLRFLKDTRAFVRSHRGLAVMCAGFILLSALPYGLFKAFDTHGQHVAPHRHFCDLADEDYCFQKTFEGAAGMTYQEAARGNIGGRIHVVDLFANQDKLSYAQDSLFFLPVFCYLLIVLGVLTRADRLLMLLLSTGLMIFLIAAADASFLHRMLYHTVFYFRYFRNLLMFMVHLQAVLILVACYQFERLRRGETAVPVPRRALIGLVTVAHLLFLLFLMRINNVMSSELITVGISLGVWILILSGALGQRRLFFLAALAAVVVVHPLEFFSAYTRHARIYPCALPLERSEVAFRFERPAAPPAPQCEIFHHVQNYRDYWYTMAMQDTPARVLYSGTLSRWVFLLNEKMPAELLKAYATPKLIVYSSVEALDGKNPVQEAARFQAHLEHYSPSALISNAHPEELQWMNHRLRGGVSPRPIAQRDSALQVTRFDTNRLEFRTRFAEPQFLVYNDSFNPYWQVDVNGRRTKLYRANVAFKGVFLPAGENAVRFVYAPPGGGWIYGIVFAGYTVMLLWLMRELVALRRERRGTDGH